MIPSSLKTRMMTFMEGYGTLTVRQKRELATGTIEIIGSFFYEFYIPSTWSLMDIERKENELVFYWVSHSEEAVCSNCGTLSHRKSKMYFTRPIQDLPIAGMTVHHEVRGNRFFCNNTECDVKNFYEQVYEIAEKDAMMSDRLKDFIIRHAIESSANAAPAALKQIGIIVSRDTILRLIKKKGSAVVEQNLQRDDVKVLSVDDINLRKGNSSTACSVFIDGETHRVLVIVQGATKEIAERVMKQFPSSTIVSRDRGTAYSGAATHSGKIQVADGFHLVQNIHQVVKDVLYQEISHDLFVREGDGWIRLVNSASEGSEDVSASDDSDCLVVCGPATLAE
ncbi:MAG: transposase, partial [Erysipelotrichaceae bacterium]|nr:transposase [Erysipelotrichaceae bacterium]